MGFLNRDSLEAILRPLKNKLDNCVTKDNAEFNENITIDYCGNKAKISNNKSYVRVNIGDSNLDFTNEGELKINGSQLGKKYTEFTNVGNNITNYFDFQFTKNTDIPYIFSCGSAVAIGNDIYLLGSNSAIYSKYNYKYDTTTDTYTRMTDIPYVFSYGSAVAIDNNIYLLGGASIKCNYKYDITTNTYTQMPNIPYEFLMGSAVAIGNDIYLLGSNGDYKKYNYKYDTTTNTYTKNTNIPYAFSDGSAVAIGTDIYLLGSGNGDYRKYNYKYDTTTNTYTKNKDIPSDNYIVGININDNIYLFSKGEFDYNNRYNYKYNIDSDSYTPIYKLSIDYFYNTNLVVIGNEIYRLGSDYSGVGAPTDYNYKYTIDDVKFINYQYISSFTSAYDNNSSATLNNDKLYLFTTNNKGYYYYNNVLNEISFNINNTTIINTISVGTDIYIFTISGSTRYNYKYNTLTNSCTKMTNVPYKLNDKSSIISIGSIIYLFGGDDDTVKTAYKYDTSSDTYTQLADIPYNFYCGSAIAIGTDIYLLGGNYTQYNYKYNTLTDSYTEMSPLPPINATKLPSAFNKFTVTSMGTNIYIIGNFDSSYLIIKYDTITDKYSITNNSLKSSLYYSFNINDDIFIITGTNITTSDPYYIEFDVYKLIPNSSKYVNIIKKSGHSIYTEKNSYTDEKASIIKLEADEYYTEYDGNYIVKNTFPIDNNCYSKIYLKSGAILNNTHLYINEDGWDYINIYDYL